MSKIKFYSYFRSSAAFRVRIALNLKKIGYEYVPVHLTKGGGEQNQDSYSAINSMKEIPSIEIDGKILSQSMAILGFLDAKFPEPRLFPEDPFLRAQVIQFSENVNAGIHPVQNLKVLQELEKRFGCDQAAKNSWAGYWIERGFRSLEAFLKKSSGIYVFGDQLTAADLFLVPQVFNAIRYKVDMAPFPKIQGVHDQCMKQDAFLKAQPSAQPDFES